MSAEVRAYIISQGGEVTIQQTVQQAWAQDPLTTPQAPVETRLSDGTVGTPLGAPSVPEAAPPTHNAPGESAGADVGTPPTSSSPPPPQYMFGPTPVLARNAQTGVFYDAHGQCYDDGSDPHDYL